MKRVILIILCLLLGIGLLSYPAVSNYLVQKNGSYAIQEYDDQIAVDDNKEEMDAQRALAEEYNAKLTGQGITDPFIPGSGIVLPDNYSEIMDFANHMMGYIEIPKINVKLPIYHGVSAETLQIGAGHMSETAFPIGGLGNHSVITGHTGLSSAKLFTDLIELEEGDEFYIKILGETLAYKVDQIKVVLPDVTEDLLPVADKDYITLITCTPYAVNSHRLLVRGERTEYVEDEFVSQHHLNTTGVADLDKKAIIYGASAGLVVLFLIILLLILRNKKKNEKRYTNFVDIVNQDVNSEPRFAAAGPKHHAKGAAKVAPPVPKQGVKTAPAETKRVAKSTAKVAPKGPQHAKRRR